MRIIFKYDVTLNFAKHKEKWVMYTDLQFKNDAVVATFQNLRGDTLGHTIKETTVQSINDFTGILIAENDESKH
jgi:hypothetical protein